MIVVIVPAFNEAQNIGRVVSGLFQNGFTQVVVVDDGSYDNTANIAGALGATVIRHCINRGQGAALETGNEYARQMGADIVVHFDADDQFDPADIAGAVDLIKQKKIDVVLGSRFLDKRSHVPWSKRVLLLPLARRVNWVVTGINLSDAHNGFRALSRRALHAIRVNQDTMAHNSEIIAAIKKSRLLWAEYPVRVTYHEYGQGPIGGLRVIYDLCIGHLLKR